MSDDIVERLKVLCDPRAECLSDGTRITQFVKYGTDARHEITRLRAENERLREALRPFADDAAKYWSDAEYTPDGSAVGVDVGDLRRARAALEGVTEPASPWSDIESAPKDKEILIAGKMDDGTDYQEVCKYFDAANCWPIVFMHGYLAPTHWMHLQEPPR